MAAILLGERFGRWPWELRDQPADDVRYFVAVMGVQAEARAALEGLSPDEPFYREG